MKADLPPNNSSTAWSVVFLVGIMVGFGAGFLSIGHIPTGIILLGAGYVILSLSLVGLAADADALEEKKPPRRAATAEEEGRHQTPRPPDPTGSA